MVDSCTFALFNISCASGAVQHHLGDLLPTHSASIETTDGGSDGGDGEGTPPHGARDGVASPERGAREASHSGGASRWRLGLCVIDAQMVGYAPPCRVRIARIESVRCTGRQSGRTETRATSTRDLRKQQ